MAVFNTGQKTSIWVTANFEGFLYVAGCKNYVVGDCA